MRKPFLQLALAKAKDLPPKPFQTTLTATSSWPFTIDRPASPTRPTRIAVLDSSFNPPTKAHYQLLKAAARVGCDAVLLLLATNNVDKGQTGAGAVERLEMMEAVAIDSIRNEKEDPALRHMAVGLTVSSYRREEWSCFVVIFTSFCYMPECVPDIVCAWLQGSHHCKTRMST
jgi:hypothetical protein